MPWLVVVGLACSTSVEAPDAAPERSPPVARSSKVPPSAAKRGPDVLVVSAYGEDPPVVCSDCDRCRVSDVTATSTRPPEGGVRFDAAHLVDGNPSSVWCSGPVADPPPSVTFAIPEGCRIHGASILSGHVGHPGKLVDNGRAAEIELSAGRLRGAAEIDDPVGLELNAKQLITKPATLFAGWEAYAVDRLTVTFTQIHRGTQHPGVCLSELRPILAGRPTAK